MKKTIALIMLFAIFTFTIYGQVTKTWTGAVSNNYLQDDNWDPPGVPCSDNNVYIPSGTPVCEMGHYDAYLQSITNYGTLELKGTQLSAATLENYGNIDALRQSGIPASLSGRFFLPLELTNVGQINSYDGTCNIHNISNIYNSGTITGNTVNIETTSMTNNGTLNSGNGGIDIHCDGQMTNNGAIYTNYGINTYTGEITISAGEFTNNNLIKGGDNDSDDQTGGSIYIIADKVTNSEDGRIIAGNHETRPNADGTVDIAAKEMVNKGEIKGGKSEETIVRDTAYYNNVFLCSESIVIDGDSVLIEADTLQIVFDSLEISDIPSFADIYADHLIEFYGVEGSVINLSDNDENNIIFVAYGAVHIYTDYIIEPTIGLNALFSPDPDVFPANTGFIHAALMGQDISDTTGSSGQCRFIWQNQSTASRSFNYEASSLKGWVGTITGTTPVTAPFEFDTIWVNYDIPVTIDTIPDTVTLTLSGPGGYSISAKSIIGQIPGTCTPIIELEQESEMLHIYPNPFRSVLNISSIMTSRVRIFDPAGRHCKTFDLAPGQTVTWKPGNNNTTGTYLIVSEYDGNISTQKATRIE